MQLELSVPKSVLQERLLIRIGKSADKRIGAAGIKKINKELSNTYKDFLFEVENHPISQEINAGPYGENLTGSLPYGNLFSFLGFESGSLPVKALIRILEKRMPKATFSGKESRGRYTFNVELPNKDEIKEETPLDWAPGRSWVFALEEGVSGLGRYLTRKDNKGIPSSRSGSAIQVKTDKPLRGGQLRGQKYMSAMLVDLRLKIKKSLRK